MRKKGKERRIRTKREKRNRGNEREIQRQGEGGREYTAP